MNPRAARTGMPTLLPAGPGTGWLAAAILITALLHSAGFSAFWIGDDFGTIHQLFTWASHDQLWAGLFEKMTDGNTPAGAFYRPATQLIRGLTWLIAGPHYAGWFAVAWLLHLANVWLLMTLVVRLTGAAPGSFLAAALAGLFFGISPVAAEGVYWIASGADAWVTLLILLSLHCWFGRAPWLVPVLFLLALGFKESAAVLPLQLALLLPLRREDGRSKQRLGAAAACLLLLVAYFGLRYRLFGGVWAVYTDSSAGSLAQALASLAPWWNGLTVSANALAAAYLWLALLAAIVVLAGVYANRRAILVLGLGAAAGGLFLATLLNLGGLSPNGEGGRLLYTALAWLAIAAGVGLSGGEKARVVTGRVILSLTVFAGAALLYRQYARLQLIQSATREFVADLAGWPLDHPGLTLLIVPEQIGSLPVFRNAQSGLVMPPLQAAPMLHRVLPTLKRELPARYRQIEGGLISRIADTRPDHLDWKNIAQLLEPAPPRWPDHYACWSWGSEGIVALQRPPRDSSASAWSGALSAAARRACDQVAK